MPATSISIWPDSLPPEEEAIAAALRESGPRHSDTWMLLLGLQDAIAEEVLDLLSEPAAAGYPGVAPVHEAGGQDG